MYIANPQQSSLRCKLLLGLVRLPGARLQGPLREHGAAGFLELGPLPRVGRERLGPAGGHGADLAGRARDPQRRRALRHLLENYL